MAGTAIQMSTSKDNINFSSIKELVFGNNDTIYHSNALLSFPFLIPLYDKGKGNISCPLGIKEAKVMAYMSCDLVSFLWVVVKYFPLNLSHHPASGLGL